VLGAGEAEAFEKGAGARFPEFAGDALHFEAECGVFECGLPGEQRVLLADQKGTADAVTHFGEMTNRAFGGLEQTGEEAEESRLTAAGGADHGEEFGGVGLQAEIPQDGVDASFAVKLHGDLLADDNHGE
jgi:hypothetical protein